MRDVGHMVFKILFTWMAVWIVLACPVWGSRELFVFGMKMLGLGAIAVIASIVVAIWRAP